MHLFNVSHEGNIPTWYSSFSLLCCAVLLALIAFDERASGGRRARHWAGLSLLLLYAAIDEGARIHELLNAPLRAAFDTHGLLYYPAAAAGARVCRDPRCGLRAVLLEAAAATRMLFLLSAAVYLGGALGVESISAAHAERFGQQNMTYALLTTVEELGEMVGVVIFVYALLSYMAEHTRPIAMVARRLEAAATAGGRPAARSVDSRRGV